MNFFAGFCMGLVIGWFAGLSASPVVAALLATLASIAVAFISMRKTPEKSALLRVVGFGIGCVVAGGMGIYIRANNVLGLTPSRAVNQWRAAGLPDDELRSLLKAHLLHALIRGRSLAGITLGIDNIAEAPPDTVAKDRNPKDNEEKRASPPVTPAFGLGGFLGDFDQDGRSTLIDILEKKPSWETARQSYASSLHANIADLDWLQNSSIQDADKVSILLALIRQWQPKNYDR